MGGKSRRQTGRVGGNSEGLIKIKPECVSKVFSVESKDFEKDLPGERGIIAFQTNPVGNVTAQAASSINQLLLSEQESSMESVGIHRLAQREDFAQPLSETLPGQSDVATQARQFQVSMSVDEPWHDRCRPVIHVFGARGCGSSDLRVGTGGQNMSASNHYGAVPNRRGGTRNQPFRTMEHR